MSPAATEETTERVLVRAPWRTVTSREILVKITDRSFVLSTVLTTVMLIAAVALSAFLSARTSTYTVATAEEAVATVADTAAEAIEAGGDELELLAAGSAQEVRDAVGGGEADAGLVRTGEGYVLVGDDEIPGALQGAMTQAVRDAVLAENAAAAGSSLAELEAGSELAVQLLNEDSGQNVAAQVLGFVFAFLFYMAAIMFGMTIANSVLEEKQNRVVEILATAIPVRQLLYGKVLGNSILAFAQIALYAVVGLVAVNAAGLAQDIGWMVGASGWFIAFFAVGFLALAAVWAVLGSLASRAEDLQSNTGPIIVVIMAVLFVGLFATGPLLTAASFVPVMSSVAMPVRLLAGDVALWQPIVSLLLTGAAAYLMVRGGERIYQRAVMQGGTALSWRQALRLES
ncbi:ABC transporter permease [Ruania suaedae]|uniref:ABC transporter permease n=1 Tax=Ruania suaedae TaxID=2897774 RepID=UPI001E58D2C8|nr:ABC transporter permease [Ruania suaedae]UFU04492.1 ABC transporter permease [Ruania suaedae]